MWLEVSVTVDPEIAEAISEVFNRLNPQPDGRSSAIVEVPGPDLGTREGEARAVVRTYLPDTPEGRARLRRLEEALGHLNMIRPVPEPTVRRLSTEDWSEAWKQHYTPLRLGERTWVVPAWLPPPETGEGEVLVFLEPGMAFGTGLHPSTRLAVRLLEQTPLEGARVLDVGTGSGILAIIAALLGAAHVTATDVDPLAVEAARENVQRNRVTEHVHVYEGSLPKGRPPFDVVVVNILPHIILDLLERGLWDYVKPGGRLLLSGIIREREPEVTQAVRDRGGILRQRVQEEDWVGLMFEKGRADA